MALKAEELERKKLIKKYARIAAGAAENAEVALLIEDNSRGSIYQILLSQFKRALGIMAVRTNAETKLEHIPFIKNSVAAADAMAATAA